jgi:hypothetical protein
MRRVKNARAEANWSRGRGVARGRRGLLNTMFCWYSPGAGDGAFTRYALYSCPADLHSERRSHDLRNREEEVRERPLVRNARITRRSNANQ